MTTNPVMQALIGARLKEEPSAFGKWCIVRGVRSLPALPVHVANFITDLAAAEKSVKQIWPMVKEISQTHLSNGLADPTAGGVVGDMINSIALIDPPGHGQQRRRNASGCCRMTCRFFSLTVRTSGNGKFGGRKTKRPMRENN
jgi:hypothetical protein